MFRRRPGKALFIRAGVDQQLFTPAGVGGSVSRLLRSGVETPPQDR